MGLTKCDVPGLDRRLATRSALGATGPYFPMHRRRIEVRARRAVEVNAHSGSTKMDARVEDVPRADIVRGVLSDSRVS